MSLPAVVAVLRGSIRVPTALSQGKPRPLGSLSLKCKWVSCLKEAAKESSKIIGRALDKILAIKATSGHLQSTAPAP